MQITINNEPIDFTLEDETDLGEIVSEIGSWLRESGFTIRALHSDNEELALDAQESWEKIPVDNVGSLNVDAVTQPELAYERAVALKSYFRLLEQSLSSNETVARDLLTDGEAVAALLEQSLGASEAAAFRKAGNAYVKDSQPDPSDLTAFAATVCSLADGLAKEFENPIKELFAVAGLLKRTASELEQTPIQLQTGKEREAMETVLRFIDLTQRFTRLHNHLLTAGAPGAGAPGEDAPTVDGVPLPEFYEEFNGLLSELGEALDAGDAVTVGDLLEYEISPRTGKLVGMVQEFQMDET